MVALVVIVAALVLHGATVGAQDVPDSTRVPIDTIGSVADSLRDSLVVPADTLGLDTLSDIQKAQIRFEERYRQMQASREEQETQLAPMRYFDSLVAYFAPGQLDKREVIARSFYHDAGDYFRFAPAHFVIDRQVTPMRKTVAPYTLAGNRLNVMHGRSSLYPFEHSIEPDGLVDMNDVPTALDDRVYVLDGPAGAVFGGDQGIATLLTIPRFYDDYDAHSAFLVDKGSYGYSYARARYLRRFEDGRDLKFSLGYRNADGPYFRTDDDAYHYTGDFYVPVRGKVALRAQGRLYRRKGPLRIQPDISGTVVNRDRFDRSGDIGLQFNDPDGGGNWQVRYRYRRESSDISGVYLGRFNQTGHGATLAREWMGRDRALQAEVTTDNLSYNEGYESFERNQFGAFVAIADLSDGWRYAVRLGTHWNKDDDVLPAASAMAVRESNLMLLMVSAGYNSREPSLMELHLPMRRSTIYPLGTLNYADRGNDSLSKETQVTASALVRVGSDRANVTLIATGGRIADGIDWVLSNEVIEGNSTRVFSPMNGDIDFATISAEPAITLWDFVRFSAGGAYFFTEYELYPDGNRPYAPDYQGWAGGELHVYWPQRLIHLFAYGEVVYSSAYDGYYDLNLGQDPVFNARLSLQMGKFRFHFIFQNVLNRVYASRENSSFLGRFNSYGFTWEFLN